MARGLAMTLFVLAAAGCQKDTFNAPEIPAQTTPHGAEPVVDKQVDEAVSAADNSKESQRSERVVPADEKAHSEDSSAEEATEEVYIPTDLADCFAELKRLLAAQTIETMKNGTQDDMVRYHHGLGRWLRNNWGLWADSRLAKWFKKREIHHADDMSGIILDSFWRHLNSKPIELDQQIKYYQQYWKKVREERASRQAQQKE